MALQSSAEDPVPVRTVSKAIGDWVSRLGAVWVEGQVAQLSQRPGMRLAFVTLRDPSAEVSLDATVPTRLLETLQPPVGKGALVVARVQPRWHFQRGSLRVEVSALRRRGEGELWAQIERRKQLLAAEGLFRPERKRPLPFLPGKVGLVCGRASAAEHDVLENARARWPAIAFDVRNVPVQGVRTVPEVTAALRSLDEDPTVDVIILARGGGSVEDLLPFSDEGLVRAVVACQTPVVSAIGHETDTPLVDLAADLRASTPTDAAKRVVPDVHEELRHLRDTRRRGRDRAQQRLTHERSLLDGLRERAVLREAATRLTQPLRLELAGLRSRSQVTVTHRLTMEQQHLRSTTDHLRALSPGATLARGYAIAHDATGRVIRDSATVLVGQSIQLRLHHGTLGVTVTDADPPSTGGTDDQRQPVDPPGAEGGRPLTDRATSPS